jgi:AcrR family transcriptional regulator
LPVPTGIAIRDPRQQLFAAATRVLLRDGPNGLTSRAVTTEAGVAKGVLHKHFADFDGFLFELVLERIAQLEAYGEQLRTSAGTGTVAGNVAAALTEIFDPVALSIVGLNTFRDQLRARLRAAGLAGIPVLGEAKGVLAGYLTAERRAGRIAPESDVDTTALTLIGAGHLLFAGETADERAVQAFVTSVLGR